MIKQDDEERLCAGAVAVCGGASNFLSLSLSPSIQMVKSSVRSIPERAQHTNCDSLCRQQLWDVIHKFLSLSSFFHFLSFFSFFVRSLLLSSSLRCIHPTRRDLGDVGTSVGRTLSRRADANANHSRRQSRTTSSLCRFH